MELKNLPLTETETGLKALGLNFNKILTGEELHAYIQSLVEKYHSGSILPELPEADYYENQSAASFILDRRDISVTRIIRYMPAHWFTCDYFELYYLFSGESVVHFEDEGIRISHGSVLLVAPGTLHATLCANDDTILLSFNIRRENFNTLFWNTLSGHDLMSSFLRRAFTDEGNRKQYLHFETGEDTELQVLATRIFEESESDRAYSGQMMNALMSTFFALLLRGYESTVRFPAADKIRWKPEYSEIIDYIEQNSKTVTIKELSKRFHYSDIALVISIFGKGIRPDDRNAVRNPYAGCFGVGEYFVMDLRHSLHEVDGIAVRYVRRAAGGAFHLGHAGSARLPGCDIDVRQLFHVVEGDVQAGII